MIYYLSLRKPSLLPTLDTKWMLNKKVRSLLLPFMRMIKRCCRTATNILIILFVHELLVLRAVAVIRQLWASRIGTGLLWLVWHSLAP